MTTATMERRASAVDDFDLDNIITEDRGQAERAYRDMVLGIVEGRRFSRDDVRNTQADAGRTLEHLRKDIRTAKDRQQALSDLARADEIEREELPRLEAASEAAKGKCVAWCKENHVREANPEHPLSREWTAAYEAVQAARREAGTLRQKALHLLSTTCGEEYHADFARLSDRAVTLTEKLRPLRDHLARGRFQAKLQAAREQIEYQSAALESVPGGVPWREDKERKLAELREFAASCERELSYLPVLEAQAAEARAEFEEIQRTRFYDWKEMSFA